jgi:hypothetical protein
MFMEDQEGTIYDNKYVVVKREDARYYSMHEHIPEGNWIKDAIVIRRQDAFAASALDTYCDSIMVTVHAMEQMLKDIPMDDLSDEALMHVNMLHVKIKRLRDIANYFGRQAEQSRADGGRLPD